MSRQTAYKTITQDGKTITDIPVRDSKHGAMVSGKVFLNVVELFEKMDKEGLKEIRYEEINQKEND